MSALELYTLSPYAEYSYTPFFLTISIIAFASLIKIHLMYTGELDKYSAAFDKRLAALESVTKDLAATDSTHDKLLEEHGEEISLAAEPAYRGAACLPEVTKSWFAVYPSAGRRNALTIDPNIIYIMDDPIQKFLRTSPKKTAREIFSHLSCDDTFKAEWKRFPDLDIHGDLTRHDVNSRLYSLLAQGKLKKDNGARPVWSVV